MNRSTLLHQEHEQIRTLIEIIEERVFDRDCGDLFDRTRDRHGAEFPANTWTDYMTQVRAGKVPVTNNVKSDVPEHYITVYNALRAQLTMQEEPVVLMDSLSMSKFVPNRQTVQSRLLNHIHKLECHGHQDANPQDCTFCRAALETDYERPTC
jgi:hypothetical protein